MTDPAPEPAPKRSAHALLSPSSADRWIRCPASIAMSAKVIEEHGEVESGYAREGTNAHRIAEIQAARHFGLVDEATYQERFDRWAEVAPFEQQEDMLRYAALYVLALQEIVEDTPQSHVLLEQRLDTGVEFCWGTADAVVVSPTHLHVIDYKYGQGVAVGAHENPQLMLYGVGALDMFGILGETETVSVSIFQPRLGQRSTYSIAANDLRTWREETVSPRAELALGENAPFGPSLDACRFCPAAGECKPRMLHMTRIDFGDPDILTPAEIAENVGRLQEIRDWCNALEATALNKAYSEGVPLPGWKVVLSGGRRSIPDVDSAVKVLSDAGYPAELVSRLGIKPLGELEKLVGKKELPELLGGLMVRSDGKPSLVPEDDKRPAIDPTIQAVKDFS